MQQTAETFAAVDPLGPLASTCDQLRMALSTSLSDGAFKAAATRAFAWLVASTAGFAGDESDLAHLEQHYESGALKDPGQDDKCSPQEIALESLRRGLAYGVAHYRSTAMWNAHANYSMAEARRWLTSIVGQSADLNTPQVVSATRRFLGHQWLSLAGERNQVARQREAERKLDRAQRAVAAARRSRLAREAAFEVWEDVDNYEESFGTEMENVVFDEDLKTGVRVRSKYFPRIDQWWPVFSCSSRVDIADIFVSKRIPRNFPRCTGKAPLNLLYKLIVHRRNAKSEKLFCDTVQCDVFACVRARNCDLEAKPVAVAPSINAKQHKQHT